MARIPPRVYITRESERMTNTVPFRPTNPKTSLDITHMRVTLPEWVRAHYGKRGIYACRAYTENPGRQEARMSAYTELLDELKAKLVACAKGAVQPGGALT